MLLFVRNFPPQIFLYVVSYSFTRRLGTFLEYFSHCTVLLLPFLALSVSNLILSISLRFSLRRLNLFTFEFSAPILVTLFGVVLVVNYAFSNF